MNLRESMPQRLDIDVSLIVSNCISSPWNILNPLGNFSAMVLVGDEGRWRRFGCGGRGISLLA